MKTFTLKNPDWFKSISETAKNNALIEAKKYAVDNYPASQQPKEAKSK